ncbi:MAG: LCP family protein [Chloroflexi bacterium]|nr:LCP family protein [Chloroflexota bacterium]
MLRTPLLLRLASACASLVLVAGCLGGESARTPPVAPVEPTPTAEPRPVPQSLFGAMMAPFIDEAQKRRVARAAADPAYARRVDPELNRNRVNFLLFGYGETHEPPRTEIAYTGSHSILSYDYQAGKLDMVSITHDTRAPELERFFQAEGRWEGNAQRIESVYREGGLNLQRLVLEDATGLSVDFQLVFQESALASLTDSVFQGVTVEVPAAFSVNAMYLDGQKYPALQFPAGPVNMDGKAFLQYIKTTAIEDTYDKRLEPNARKALAMSALTERLQEKSRDVSFWFRALQYVNEETSRKRIVYDFDPGPLLVNNFSRMIQAATRAVNGGGVGANAAAPSLDRTVYVVDPASGDGGVQWINANKASNPNTARDLARNRYPDINMEVPYNGDADAADLVSGYWLDVRKLVAARLNAPRPSAQAPSPSAP